MPLTAKQIAFIDYYADPTSKTYNNATLSAIKAGYEKKSAKVSGHNNITNYNVKKVIDTKIAEKQAKIEYNYEIAVKELNQVIDNLALQAKNGNISANSALTQAIREKNAITGLHKQTIKTETVGPQLDESEKAVLGPIVRDFKLKLAGGA